MEDVNENFMNKKRDSKFSCFLCIIVWSIIIAFFVYSEKSAKKQDIEENTNNNEVKQQEVIKTSKNDNNIIYNLLNSENLDDLDAGIREKEVYIICLDEIITNSNNNKAISEACVKVFEQQKIKEENKLKEIKEFKKYINEAVKDLLTGNKTDNDPLGLFDDTNNKKSGNNNNNKEKTYAF